jgi:hypothetical protein
MSPTRYSSCEGRRWMSSLGNRYILPGAVRRGRITVPLGGRVREALERALHLKTRLAATRRELGDADARYREIAAEQSRMRANVKELPPTAPAYKRYLEKFDAQETEVERLQARLQKLRDAEKQERQEYETFLANAKAE